MADTHYQKLSEGLQKFGRFLIVRRGYSFLRHAQQYLESSNTNSKDTISDGTSIFFEHSISEMIKATQKTALSAGFHLDSNAVLNIRRFAEIIPVTEPGYRQSFYVNDLDAEGKLPDGHVVLRALVHQPSSCPEVAAVAKHPTLIDLATGYLGYQPDRVSCHLTWSIASGLPKEKVDAGYPASTFHYDIAGFNFATVYFYITSVPDETCGPHVMFLKSHHRKALTMLLRSGRQSSEHLYRFYGREQEYVILGEAGFGFFQDPSCFHRVLPPRQNHRLLLQIRYA